MVASKAKCKEGDYSPIPHNAMQSELDAIFETSELFSSLNRTRLLLMAFTE
jgi:hypothetical protein